MKTKFVLSNAVIMHGKAYGTGETIATIETPDGVDLDRVLNAIVKGHAIAEPAEEVAVDVAAPEIPVAVLDGLPSPVAPAKVEAKTQAEGDTVSKVETAGESAKPQAGAAEPPKMEVTEGHPGATGSD